MTMAKKKAVKTVGTKFRPSNADRYLNCPASVVMAQDLPDGDGTQYSNAGNVAHALAEECFDTGKKAIEFLGQRLLEGEGIKIPVNEEMVVDVQSYVDWVNAQGFSQTYVERTLEFPWIKNKDGSFTTGKADYIGYSADFNSLSVLDYKNGVMVVPNDSYQFGCYAYPLMFDEELGFSELEQVTAGRYQPNAMSGSPVGTHVWTRDDLIHLRTKIELAVAWVAKSTPEDVKDEDYCEGHWCKFCPYKTDCPARAKKLFDTMDDIETNMDDSLPVPSTLTPEKIRIVLERRSEIKKWLDDVYNHQMAMALKEGAPDGMKLVSGRSKPRAWQKHLTSGEITAGLEKAGLLKDECYQPLKMITPAGAKKVLKNLDKVEDLLTPAEKSTELVPESDKRNAIDGSDFFPAGSDSE